MPLSCLPTYPLILFGIIEPALLIWAYIYGLVDTQSYFSSQASNHPLPINAYTPQAEALTLQMINMHILAASMAIICCWTTNTTTTKRYLFCVALADLGHIYATYRGVGSEYFWDVWGWNDMVAGNVGVVGCLHMLRWMTLGGVFGTVGENAKVKGS